MGYARKDVEKTKKLAKKFVRYQKGAELYSIGADCHPKRPSVPCSAVSV